MNSAVSDASMSSYAILGCGSVGHAVAEELLAGEKDVLILDRDEGRVDALRDQDLDARTADIREQATVFLWFKSPSAREAVANERERLLNVRAGFEVDHERPEGASGRGSNPPRPVSVTNQR